MKGVGKETGTDIINQSKTTGSSLMSLVKFLKYCDKAILHILFSDS